MGKTLSINLDVYNGNISSLKASVSEIEFSSSAKLANTDTNPFKEYEQTVQDLSKMLVGYKSILENDAEQMASIGKAIAEADKKTAELSK